MNFDQYLENTFRLEDDILKDVKADIIARHMPAIFVPAITGAFLRWLVESNQSKNILEIGALGGYSGIWLARGLNDDGHLTSLELRQDYADVAYANLSRAHLSHKARYVVGPALDSLQNLTNTGAKFDFFFIDADKGNYPRYLDFCLQLAHPGAIIAADNTLMGERVLHSQENSPDVTAIREYNTRVAQDDRLAGLLLPIGDGLTVARVI